MKSLVITLVLAMSLAACGASERTATTGEVRLLDGGVDAFEQKLTSLRGRPVVVNQWASWCTPCRQEFPIFSTLADRYDGRVAFLGVDSKDSRDSAEQFLAENPVPYPNFHDPEGEIARTFRGGRAWPTTAFYTRDGKLAFTHYGAYRDEQQLVDDIERYALDG